MTRVLEFVVALIMVFILAVIVGFFMPTHAHIERSIEISHNPQHIYDVFNNFRRFADYVGGDLQASDPQVKFALSGPAYGKGATLSWTGNNLVGDGKLVNDGGSIDITGNSTVKWSLTNNWHGEDKVFTLQVEPRQNQRVSTVTWSYVVDYGWNPFNRYSRLWIHGEPATMIQYGLDSLQNMMAGIPNVDYSKINPGLYKTQPTPVLLVSTKAPRTLDDIDSAKSAAVAKIDAAMKKLGVKAAGPTTTITTEYGDTTYIFDVAVPIDTTTLTIDGQAHDLTQLPKRPLPGEERQTPAASAGSAGLPAAGSTSGAPAGPAPGSLDKLNQLIVNADVRAAMIPAGEVLEATWTGEAGVPLMRLALKAYAGTHGYTFDDTVNRIYDELTSLPSVADQDQIYRVFLPVQNAPTQTPEQISGQAKPPAALDPSLWTGAATATKEDEAAKDQKKPEARKKAEAHRPAARRHRR
jgi:hypothetical protein